MKTQIKLSKWCLANKPSLLDEWDYDKNDDIENYTYGSNKKVWWFCKFGHNYQMRINHKTVDDIGCPICNKERKTSFPEKAIFYYVKKCFADAEENKNFNWLGKKEVDIYIPSINVAIEYDGYHWHSNIEKDTIKDNICNNHNIYMYRIRIDGCPNYDSNSIKIYYGKTYKIKDLDGAIKKLFDLLNINHNFNICCDVDIERDSDTIISEYISKEKEISIASKRPDLVSEWDFKKNKVSPDYVSLHSNRSFWWICPKCGYNYKMKVNDRTGQKHSSCPVCAGKRVAIGINDLFTTNPELKNEWDFDRNIISPSTINAGSHKKVYWICPKGHSYLSIVYVRAKMKCGCPICGHQIVGYNNSFADLYPNLLCEWNYKKNTVDPYQILPQSNKKYWWKCSKCGYEWETAMSHRTEENKGCPLCAHQVLVKGINDLETQFPEIAKEWNYDKNVLKPYEVSGGTNKKYWWKCSKCGYEWECVVASRTKRGSKCPVCRKK